jgi:hypothetical protein
MRGHDHPDPRDVFFLIVADLDTGMFCVEGPMFDDAPWHLAVDRARQLHDRHVSAARPAQTATRLPANSSRRTRWRAFHRAASCGHLGKLIAVLCPREFDVLMRNAGGSRRWLIERQRIGPVIRTLQRTTDPLFRRAGLNLDHE